MNHKLLFLYPESLVKYVMYTVFSKICQIFQARKTVTDTVIYKYKGSELKTFLVPFSVQKVARYHTGREAAVQTMVVLGKRN